MTAQKLEFFCVVMDSVGIERCPSESSSISATLEGSSHSDDGDHDQKKMVDMKMKERVDRGSETSPFSESRARVLLDLKLSSNDSIRGSKLELNLFSPINDGSTSRANESTDEASEQAEARVFSCNFCKREFSTSQALGGHQNAHKQERALAKRRQGMEASAFGHFPYYPYSSFSTHPYYGSYNRSSSLGVRMDSLIHKESSYPWTSVSGYRYGLEGLTSRRQAVMNTQPSIDRLKERLNALSGGIGISSGSPPSKLEDNGLFRNFGASPPSNNIGTNMSSSDSKLFERQDPPKSDPIDASGLDLSLKL